jgi:hypothetical protein
VSAPAGEQRAADERGPAEALLAERDLRATRERVGPLTFDRLMAVSLVHSCVYLALLVCGFAAGKPEPLTTALGYTHGILWIGMSLACIAATRARVIPLRVAVAVAVVGGIGPFFGSFEFTRARARRR